MMLDAANYQNGQKGNWRKQCWNLIVAGLKRANIQPKDAVVLYLPGTTNLDEVVALQKGFRRENLIAVERDKKVTKFIRKSLKVNCINANIEEVLWSWPMAAPKVDVVVADLQCGLLPVVEDVIQAYVCSPQITHSVLCINAMRGRDAGSFLNFAKEYDVNVRAQTTTNNTKRFFVDERLLSDKDDPSKHRGVLMGRGFIGMLHANGFLMENTKAVFNKEAELYAKCFQARDDVYRKTGNMALAQQAYDLEDKRTNKEIDEWKEARLPFATAVPGYRSAPQYPYMDAVVLQTIAGYCDKVWKVAREARKLAESGKMDDVIKMIAEANGNPNVGWANRTMATRRKIAAALAHRTMRSRRT